MNHDSNDSLTSAVLKEVLREAKSLHRWRIIGRIFWILLIITGLGVFFLGGENKTSLDDFEPHIAVVPMHGIISQEAPVSIAAFIPVLEKAFKAENAIAVFIDANSPGGSPVQSAVINDAITRFRAKYNKPIVAVVSDLCASGCYYAIAGVDKITAHNSSIIGSIGVRLESYDLRGLMEKIGVKQRLLTAGENKAMLNPFDEFEVKERLHLQALIDESHNEFIRAVEKGRGAKLDETNPDLFSGLIWIGSEGIELGLVDELGDLYTEAENYETNKLVRYEQDKTFVEQILEMVGQISLRTVNSSLQAKYE